MTGSFQYYIDMQVEQARKDKAPENATYRDTLTGKWHTVEDVRSAETREALHKCVAKLLAERS